VGPCTLPGTRDARTILLIPYKHFMNYLIAKYSEWENNTNRKKTVAEQAIARVRASNTTLLSISRKPRGAVNLDECIVDYDFVDSDGTLMDLSVRCANKRDRVFNYLTPQSTYSFCRVWRDGSNLKPVECKMLTTAPGVTSWKNVNKDARGTTMKK